MKKYHWAVWFQDHIHTDCYGQLAIFSNKKFATSWLKKYGMPGCSVKRVVL